MGTKSYTKTRFSANDAALVLIDHQSGIMQLVHDYSPAEDDIAAALQDHAAEIIGLDAPGRSAPIVKGVNVAEEKIFQALIEEKLQPQSAAEGESEKESRQTTASTANGNFPEVGPIGLTLLTRKTVQTQKSFAVRGAQFGHDAAKLADTAGVTARVNHLEETSGAQAGILLQGLAQEVEIRISEPIAQAGMTAEAVRV
jgi:hypothetical protein